MLAPKTCVGVILIPQEETVRAALDDFALLSENDLVGLLNNRHQVPTDIGSERGRQKHRLFNSGDHDHRTAGKNESAITLIVAALSPSREAVGSSSNMIWGFARTIRAHRRHCCCPPERVLASKSPRPGVTYLASDLYFPSRARMSSGRLALRDAS